VAESGAADKVPLAGLFQVLKQIRTRAGLTQQQIAEATGAGGKHGRKLIARLEAGHVRNPSTRLVLDYLRACRTTAHDLAGFLDTYLGSPLPFPTRPRRGRRRGAAQGHDRDAGHDRIVGQFGSCPKWSSDTEDATALALRKEAAWWKARRVVEDMLHQELNKLGARPMSKERGLAAEFGRKVFRILYQTRQLRPALRERRLKRCRAWAERKSLPRDVLDHLHEAASVLFDDMDGKGQLDWLPSVVDARHLMLLPPRYRLQTDYDMCRSEYLAQMLKEHEAREAAREPVIEAALNLLKSRGLTDQQVGNYRSIITAFLNVAETTEPGSTIRAQRVAEIARSHGQSYFDQAILRHLAELIFSLSAKWA
jgi:transcriptional regulator with XRE-family HTH domain